MIPKVIHFVWLSLGTKPTDDQLIGIRSALLNTTMKVVLHTNDTSLSYPGVEVQHVDMPTSINGIPFQDEKNLIGYSGNGKRIAHVADIVRLQILYDHGGIYSDMDVIWLKNPWQFLDKKVVIGWSNKAYKILINCIIMAEPKNSSILQYRDWLVSIYPPKKYWVPANPYKLWKDNPDVFFAEKYHFNAMKWDSIKPINWLDVEKSTCLHLTMSMEKELSGEVIDSLRRNWTIG